MLNEEEYELLKTNLIDSKRLFDKLNRVADEYQEIEHDESGFSIEDEKRLQRHWQKLSTKIVQSLGDELDGYGIELKNNRTLDERELFITLVKDEQRKELSVDYSEQDSLNIIQIS